jgi:hypothetical protein
MVDNMEYDLVTIGAGSGAIPVTMKCAYGLSKPVPITAEQSQPYPGEPVNLRVLCGVGGVRASRFASSKYGAKVAVIELPFGLISSESVGGAGGTYVPNLRSFCVLCEFPSSCFDYLGT